MRLRDLGEFGLIARIERAARREQSRAGKGAGAAVSLGIGDDAALLRVRRGEEVAVSVDAFVEGVHFRFDHESPRNVGRRATVAALSDLAAMGARPLACLVSLAAPPTLELRCFDGLAGGLVAEALRHEAPVCGGNLARARETSLHVTALGAVARGRAMTRRGTRPGDWVCVTGALGASALARARAEREGRAFRHLPRPRLAAGRRLAGLPGRVACIDLSDGLRADLPHLLGPDLTLALDPERVPLARGVAAGARRLGLDPLELACAGGEDYELLFTLRTLRGRPPDPGALAARLGLPVAVLGAVEEGSGGAGSRPAGWRHF